MLWKLCRFAQCVETLSFYSEPAICVNTLTSPRNLKAVGTEAEDCHGGDGSWVKEDIW